MEGVKKVKLVTPLALARSRAPLFATIQCPGWRHVLPIASDTASEISAKIRKEREDFDVTPAPGMEFESLNRTPWESVIVAIIGCFPLDTKTLNQWGDQGVLVLDTTLTSRVGEPDSHADIWKPFIAAIIDALKKRPVPVVFASSVDRDTLLDINNTLERRGMDAIDWSTYRSLGYSRLARARFDLANYY